MQINFVLFISFLVSLVIADVSLSLPKLGASFSASSGSTSIKIQWGDDSSDSKDTFSLDNVNSYTISLCTGPSDGILNVKELVSPRQISSNEYTVTIDQKDAPNGYYYFQIYTVFEKGTTIHYSNRFRLTGMSGTTATFTSSAAVTVTGAAPAAQIEDNEATSESIDSRSFTVPYTLQTGTKRYAPMQTQPGSTVTATTWTRRFPSSSFTVYSTHAKSPVVYSTVTPGWSYKVESLINWASAAPYPTYYYPASERVSKATLSAASKRKRWLD